MPPRESIRQEAQRRGVSLYRVRAERGAAENLTKRTSVGHGPLPIKIARKVERQRQGHPRALPIKTQERYRKEIAAYERRRYKRLVTARARPRLFDSEEQAREWARLNRLSDALEEYGEIVVLPGGRVEVRLLR